MNKTVLYLVILALVAVAIIYWCNAQTKLASSLAGAARPIYLNQHNSITVNYSPSTTNIEKVEGNGNSFGDDNNVQNDMA
jgi:hypothetical protein